MKSSIKPTKARPDTNTGEKQWFSSLPVPARCKRLSTGEPIDQSFFDRVQEGIAEAVMFLEPGRPYEAKYFLGGWDDLSHGDKCRAGRCITDCTRIPGSVIGLINRGKKRYFARPDTSQVLPPQTSAPQHIQP